ncbi:MAG: FapA family protein [Treponema sp.]|jgi:uncharacterized protein (DUF342 family)|nr:FapA family protein [Treponema sp.]
MAAVIAKGNASIVINPQETEAALVFTPGPEGLGWDADAVIKLIGENRLSPPPSPKTLEPFLQKAAKQKTADPLEMVIFQGTPPEDPAGEEITWGPLPVPQDIEPWREETLAKAGKPELFRIKTEKIKRESIVKKPGPLPFLPPKEEKVVTWEKKETREAVEAVSEPREIRYAKKGEKLGTMTPPKPGKPGKNVFNKSIPPAVMEDGTYLLGAGLDREKNEIYARYSGLLRIGDHWADIIPLAKPSWKADRGADGVTFFLSFEPGDPRFSLPSGTEILAAAAAKGAAESSLVSPETVDAVIRKAAETGEAAEAIPLTLTQEALAQVDISPDKLEAVLNLRKGAAGGRPLEMKVISQALRDSKVQGFDAEKLKADIKAFMEGPELELRDYPLVQGKSPTRGADREVRLLVNLQEEGELKTILERLKTVPPGKLAAGGAVVFPMAEITAAALVEKGARAAQITGSSGGEPGKDVFGNVLPGLPGNDPELKLLRGLEQHGADITASISGLLLVNASEKSFRGQIVNYRDAQITVHVSEDAMEATVDLSPGMGAGSPLNSAAVIRALAAAGVVKGVSQAAVEAACRRAVTTGSCTGAVAARGEPPLAKNSLRVTWLVPMAAPLPGGAPRAIPVTAGTAIADISPGLPEAQAGFDVNGAVLDPEQGITVIVNRDSSIKETPRGTGVRLMAARSGYLIYDGKDLKISSVQEVKGDAGKATGNINFSGELRISGRVEPGYSVTGGLNVLIGGVAEQALVSAGGKAVIAGGIRGAGKGVVRARRTIETAFAENATLLAVEDINVKNGCVRCNIKTNGKLIISGETGKLTGGVSRARLGVNVHDLGSAKGGQTEISFGQDYLIKDQIEVTEEKIGKVKTGLKQIDLKIKQAEKSPALLNAARAEKVKLLKFLEQLNLRVFTLREKFEEHYESEVRVRGAVYPGVVLESHGRYYEVRQARSGAVFFFDRKTGRITEREI